MEWYFILAIIIGIVLLFVISLFWFFNSYFHPVSTGKISDRIAVIKTNIVNSYIYSDNSNRILIDTGFSSKSILKELNKLEIEPKEISHVFITHTDQDHIGGLELFNHAEIYFGKDSKVKKTTRYNLLEDEETINIANIEVQALATPGHRKGHMIYLVANEFLFTGDLIRLNKGEIKPFLRILSNDFQQQKRSIKRLIKMHNISILFTAHTGYTTHFTKAIEKWKE